MIASTDIKRPALHYYGGKWNLAPWIISFFPPHKNYVETCGGAASVLLQKPRSPLETYNDLDGNVVNFFRVLRDRPDELIRKIKLTPFSREEFETARVPDPGDPIENARRFFVSAWMSISCMPHDRTTGWRTASYFGQGFSLPAKNYFEMIDEGNLVDVANRFKEVQVEQRPYEYILERYDTPETLFYLDPPYVTHTRVNGNVYAFEWDDKDHVQAAYLLRECSGFVVISGYNCPIYTELYEAHGWERHSVQSQTNGLGRTRTESVWLSPRTIEALNLPRQARLL